MSLKESNKFWKYLGDNPMVNITAALIVGAGMRLWFYLLNDSFWRDETMLLLNVAKKSFWGLTGPLEYAQGCPIPVLWLYHSLYLSGLGAELPMRAMSLAASILSLFLFYRLARLAQVHEKGILFSTWLLALSPGAILFAAQAKPYALDLLIACGFLYAAAPWFIASDDSKKNALLFWYGGVAPWFSFPAIFVAGGVVGGLLLKTPRCNIRPALILISVLVLSFGLEYLTVIRHSLLSRGYILFWDLNNHAAIPKSIITLLLAYDPFLIYLKEYPLLLTVIGTLVVYLIMVGMWAAGRKYGFAWVAVLILPLLIALMASALKKYPFYSRCYLFATPGLYLLVGYAVGYLFKEISWPKLVNASIILILILCFISSIVNISRPMIGVREGLRFIINNQQKDDLVICDVYALPTVTYYQMIRSENAAALHCNGENFEKFSWGRRNPYRIRFEEIVPLIPPAGRIWCIAETDGYTRQKDKEVLEYWQELTKYLNLQRRLMTSYISDRVEVKGFAGGNRD
jgi:hypothetical protein